MEYVYLGTERNGIPKQALTGILDDVIAADNDFVDMREICKKYGLSRDERYVVEEFLKKYMAIGNSEVFRKFTDLAEMVKTFVVNGEFDKATESARTNNSVTPLSASLLQREFRIDFITAVDVIKCLGENGFLEKDEGGYSYIKARKKNDEA